MEFLRLKKKKSSLILLEFELSKYHVKLNAVGHSRCSGQRAGQPKPNPRVCRAEWSRFHIPFHNWLNRPTFFGGDCGDRFDLLTESRESRGNFLGKNCYENTAQFQGPFSNYQTRYSSRFWKISDDLYLRKTMKHSNSSFSFILGGLFSAMRGGHSQLCRQRTSPWGAAAHNGNISQSPQLPLSQAQPTKNICYV